MCLCVLVKVFTPHPKDPKPSGGMLSDSEAHSIYDLRMTIYDYNHSKFLIRQSKIVNALIRPQKRNEIDT